MSKRLSDYGRTGINLTRTAMEYPALNGEVVTQRHADYCADNGHAVHTVNGVISQQCPRCGEAKAERVTGLTTAEIKSALVYIETDHGNWAEYPALVAELRFRRDFHVAYSRHKFHAYAGTQLGSAISGLVRTMAQQSVTQRGQY